MYPKLILGIICFFVLTLQGCGHKVPLTLPTSSTTPIMAHQVST